MDSMVRTAMAIERKIEDARSIRDTSASGKRKEDSLLLVWGRSKRILFHEDFRDKAVAIRAKARLGLPISQDI